MTDTLQPDSPEQVLDAIQWAMSEKQPLEVVGRGSKRHVGRPVQTQHTLDLSGLTGVQLYEPDELVLSALAGTPLAEIEDLLEQNGQELAFEPMDYAGLGSGDADGNGSRSQATLGGVLAANLAGPRRIRVGAARDHVLGIHAVSGRGEAFKSGGRVVKNVTGYDLSKGLAGSWGTLAVATHITFKVLPKSETEATLLVHGLDDPSGITLLCKAMGSSCEVSGVAHLPAGTDHAAEQKSATAFRIEGFDASVAYRLEKLGELVAGAAERSTLAKEDSQALWQRIRDVGTFSASDAPLWRLSVTPTEAPAIVSTIRSQGNVKVYYDWSGGLIWLQVDGDGDDTALADVIRNAIGKNGGGHATLVRGTPSLRTAIEPFQPQPPALAALSRRLKENFDPHGILNPGRLSTQW